MALTTRQNEMLHLILYADGYITTAEMARHLQLSSRTIQRDLDAILEELKDLSTLIEKKTGRGIRFVGTDDQRFELETSLKSGKGMLPVFSQDERMVTILMSLLMDDEPTKTVSLARDLGVSETTISADLKRCDSWLAKRNLTLTRRPGLGVYIKGHEWNRRRAMTKLYYDFIHTGQTDTTSRLPGMGSMGQIFDEATLIRIEGLLRKNPATHAIFVSDSSKRALAIHLYLVLLRSTTTTKAYVPPKSMEFSLGEQMRSLAGELIRTLNTEFRVSIPDSENYYISTILCSIQGSTASINGAIWEQAERIATRIIHKAEARTGTLVIPDSGFTAILAQHLVPTIIRLTSGLEIRNPMLDEVKTHYSDLYSIAKECSDELAKELKAPVPESEIAYIAVHIGVALEDSRSVYRSRCRVIVCCPSGMVGANLLAIRIRREFPSIEICDAVSTTHIQPEILESEKIDMVITTLPLQNIAVNCIVVSPFLSDDDKDKVWRFLRSFRETRTKQDGNLFSKEYVNNFTVLQEVISTSLAVLESLFVWKQTDSPDIHSLIRAIAHHVGDTIDDRETIIQDLTHHCKYGIPTTADKKAMLLHAKTLGVKNTWFGIIHPGKIHLENGAKPKTILLMLAPKKSSTAVTNTMSSLSRALVEDDHFVEVMHNGDYAACYQAVGQILHRFFEEIR